MRRLIETLRAFSQVQCESIRTAVPAGELLDRRMHRREFLRQAVAAGAVVATGPALLSACTGSASTTAAAPSVARFPEGAPRIVVVGAGLAGMTAAYRLWQAGLRSTVYEGDTRIGGRTETIRGVFDHSVCVEACGREINSNHVAMRRLVADLGLTMDNLDSYYPGGLGELIWIEGRPYPYGQLYSAGRRAAQPIAQVIVTVAKDSTGTGAVDGGQGMDAGHATPLPDWEHPLGRHTPGPVDPTAPASSGYGEGYPEAETWSSTILPRLSPAALAAVVAWSVASVTA